MVLVAGLLPGLAGCLPAVHHGPRVEEGWSFDAVSGFAAGEVVREECGDECLPNRLPPLGVHVRRGFAPPGRDAAFQVGLGYSAANLLVIEELDLDGGPFGFLGALLPWEVDLYAQLPSGGGAGARGVGALLSWSHIMPYVQYGREHQEGRGWHTTQGLALLLDEPDGSPLEPEMLLWMPSLAWRSRASRRVAVQAQLTGALGVDWERREFASDDDPPRPTWLLMSTFSLTFRPDGGEP